MIYINDDKVIMIEIDENQHKYYNIEEDETRTRRFIKN
jgi:hypothetical protein